MNNHYSKVKDYLIDLGYSISKEDEQQGVILIDDVQSGISNLVIGIADPLLIMEQFIFELNHKDVNIFEHLLMKNRDIIHGAFVLDETGKKVIFRDTLQIENLDQNELEASINSLSLLLSEYSDALIQFSKN